MSAGDESAEMEMLEARVRVEPTDADALLRLADLYRNDGKPQRAINVYLQSALRYGERDAWQRVAAIYKLVLMLDPSDLAVRSKLVDVYCLIGLRRDAQDELLRMAKAYQTAGNLEMRDRTLKRLETIFATDTSTPHCAFCGRLEKEVRALVHRDQISLTGSEVAICDECVKKCGVVLQRSGSW
jgi:thioredoxin-like negative regulator of GroEL